MMQAKLHATDLQLNPPRQQRTAIMRAAICKLDRQSYLLASLSLDLFVVFLMIALCMSPSVRASIVEHDTLEVGVAPPDDALIDKPDGFHFLGSEVFAYDDNVYRLAPDITNLSALPGIGPDPHRGDHTNTTSGEVDGQWSAGRQVVVGDFRVDDNRYVANTYLNNVSTSDKLVWYANAGGVLSGQVGVNYNKGLASFVNATVFTRNIFDTTSYYAAGRYQVGPRWGIFGGVLDNVTTLSSGLAQESDFHNKSVDFGTDYAVGVKNTLGWEYRYTDQRYPLGLANGDYREDTWRVYEKYVFSEKTSFDGSAGYIKRDYANTDIQSFSGDIWRLTAHWIPRDKLLVEASLVRNLQAYITEQSDYFVSTGPNVSAQWDVTEKVKFDAAFKYQKQNYIGAGPGELTQAVRHDRLTSALAGVTYTPFRFLTLNLLYTHENRGSNEPLFRYGDNILSARFTVNL